MTRLLWLAALATSLSACSSDDPGDAPAANTPPATAPEVVAIQPAPAAARDTVTLYKSPSCGCCRLWGEHMEGEGFAVVSRDVTDMTAVKDSLGVPSTAGSCHTATVGGYVVEGHVPAAQVRRLLRDRPDARGLAVPGMPLGSPGMEQGPQREAYNVLLLDEQGNTSVYESIPGTAAM